MTLWDKVLLSHPTSRELEKIHLRAGKIVEACGHPEADKLLVMKVDVGEERPRSIVAESPVDLSGRTYHQKGDRCC